MRVFVLTIVTYFGLLSGPAIADLCDAVHTAERLEAPLLDTNSQAAPIGNDAFRQLQTNAVFLSVQYIGDTALQDAVRAYTSHVMARRDDPAALSTPEHRTLLRRMVIASYDRCRSDDAPSPNDGPKTTPNAGAASSGTVYDYAWSLSFGAIFFASAIIIAIILNKIMAIRKIRRARHVCFIDVKVRSKAQTFDSNILDISGFGAKFRLPLGTKVGQTAVLNFDDKSFPIKVVWQNAHFAGCTFDRPLGLRLLRKLSQGIQDRDISNRGSSPALGASNPKKNQRN